MKPNIQCVIGQINKVLNDSGYAAWECIGALEIAKMIILVEAKAADDKGEKTFEVPEH